MNDPISPGMLCSRQFKLNQVKLELDSSGVLGFQSLAENSDDLSNNAAFDREDLYRFRRTFKAENRPSNSMPGLTRLLTRRRLNAV